MGEFGDFIRTFVSLYITMTRNLCVRNVFPKSWDLIWAFWIFLEISEGLWEFRRLVRLVTEYNDVVGIDLLYSVLESFKDGLSF